MKKMNNLDSADLSFGIYKTDRPTVHHTDLYYFQFVYYNLPFVWFIFSEK